MISFAFLENNDVAQEKIARNLVLKLELSDTLYFQVLTVPLQHRVSCARVLIFCSLQFYKEYQVLFSTRHIHQVNAIAIGISKDNPLAEIG